MTELNGGFIRHASSVGGALGPNVERGRVIDALELADFASQMMLVQWWKSTASALRKIAIRLSRFSACGTLGVPIPALIFLRDRSRTLIRSTKSPGLDGMRQLVSPVACAGGVALVSLSNTHCCIAKP